jgi:transcriptional regulator, MerR family
MTLRKNPFHEREILVKIYRIIVTSLLENVYRVSTKTFRYNDEIGLINPDEFNPENGYKICKKLHV